MTSKLNTATNILNADDCIEDLGSNHAHCVIPDGYFDFLNHLRVGGKDKINCVSIEHLVDIQHKDLRYKRLR